MSRRHIRLVLTTGAGAFVLSGCVSLGPDGAAAGAAALSFSQALTAGDGATACSQLTDTVRSTLEESAGTPCASAILGEDLPAAGGVRNVSTYGHNAQVVLDGDVEFLSVVDGQWQVFAAGCQAQPDAPYDCSLSGG